MQWLRVPGFEHYMVNRHGQFVNTEKYPDPASARRKLLPRITRGKYAVVYLTAGGKSHRKPVIHIMMELFPHIFENGAVIQTTSGEWSLTTEAKLYRRGNVIPTGLTRQSRCVSCGAALGKNGRPGSGELCPACLANRFEVIRSVHKTFVAQKKAEESQMAV